MRPLTIATFVFLIAIGVAHCDESSEEEEENSDEHGQHRGEKSNNCTCGWTNKSKARIVGGKKTKVNEYPYMTSLVKVTGEMSAPFCGCALITNRHAITAAHCTHKSYRNTYDFLILLVGEHDLAKDKESEFTNYYVVGKVFEHPHFEPKNLDNDIALLYTKKKIKFNTGVGLVCLPKQPMNRFLVREKQMVKATGWGLLGQNKGQARFLMKVNLDVVPLKRCVKAFPTKTINVRRSSQICTWAEGKDTCGGDSGGPLVWLDPETNRYTLVALVSYGKKRCGEGDPAVNTDVAYHLQWIQKTVSRARPTVRTCAKEN